MATVIYVCKRVIAEMQVKFEKRPDNHSNSFSYKLRHQDSHTFLVTRQLPENEKQFPCTSQFPETTNPPKITLGPESCAS